MRLTALTWNLYHGRDFPPDPALRTRRSKVLRVRERNATHSQVNRSLRHEFVSKLAEGDWDVALLQECPPRWAAALAGDCGAELHRVLTSRNSWAPLRAAGARLNPDLLGSNEGGSNVTLVRPATLGRITERRELVVAAGPIPERRVVAFTRTQSGLCLANLHASAGPGRRDFAENELRSAAEHCSRWAAESPLILGGDLNVRPRDSSIYSELEERFGLTGTTASDSLDHLLRRGLEAVEPAAAWPAERRETADRGGVVLRLSDHAPVQATFARLP